LRKKGKTKYGEAVLIGFAIGFFFMLITPRCQEPSYIDPQARAKIKREPELAFVIDSLRAEGFAVESHYPIYVRFVKTKVDGDPAVVAFSLARALAHHTGVPDIKAQLDLADGTYLADPKRGLIDPQEIVVPK